MNGDVMNREIISIIGMGVSLAALMLTIYRGLRVDMAQQRKAVSALGTQIRQEMYALRQESKQDIKEARQESKQDINRLEQHINDLRQESKQDINRLEQHINDLRQESKQDINRLEQHINDLRREAKQDRQDTARDLKVLGERTARIQGAVTGRMWDGMMGDAESVRGSVASSRPEAEA